jgi:hypothetical protein
MGAANFKGADNSPIQIISALFEASVITKGFGKLVAILGYPSSQDPTDGQLPFLSRYAHVVFTFGRIA